ncbi:hypothetical protein F511_21943 [Dorcoceras hygrometricum]|uniref:Uncharacterized protein n=1 Tax=Dorcoceras hygrometricum TaxID=472368 RepID=A0A2Z7AZ04_9LAMI|nr:hypothetical protein F511_21943 [Dorcoceras hygrometricum]
MRIPAIDAAAWSKVYGARFAWMGAFDLYHFGVLDRRVDVEQRSCRSCIFAIPIIGSPSLFELLAYWALDSFGSRAIYVALLELFSRGAVGGVVGPLAIPCDLAGGSHAGCEGERRYRTLISLLGSVSPHASSG